MSLYVPQNTRIKGSNKLLNQLFSIAGSSSGSDEKWKEYMSLIDVNYFTDYLIVQTYIGNNDYYNQKYTHTTDNSLTWRPMFYDLDFGLKNGAGFERVGLLQPRRRHQHG